MITIVDYGAGNLKSVANMIHRVGGRSEIVADPAALGAARLILLPGVGAFDHAMRGLAAGGWVDALHEAALVRRVPVVGICLGMQLLCKGSEEGKLPGLGWIDGHARRFRVAPESGVKVPHMGWNAVTPVKDNPLVARTDEEQRFYFVHSYHVECADPADVAATAHHGEDFTAVLGRGNIHGAQFHPEKSHRFGMAFMTNVLALAC